MNIFSELKEDAKATPPAALLEMPPTVLLRINEEAAQLFEAHFGVQTLGGLVNHPLFQWIWRTYDAYKKGKMKTLGDEARGRVEEAWLNHATGDWMNSGTDSLQEVDAELARQLENHLGWRSIRDIAGSKALEASRAIHRAATGAPEESASEIKPLENFFANGTHNYFNRKREEAGLKPQPRSAPGAPAMPFTAPDNKAGQKPLQGEADDKARQEYPGAYGASFSKPKEPPKKGYSPDGAYVPRGGGSKGWYENRGVAHNELSNSYRFYQAVDERNFETDGLAQRYEEMRDAERKEMKLQVLFSSGSSMQSITGLCQDISLTGAKIRIGQGLRSGLSVELQIVERDDLTGNRLGLAKITGKVRWNTPVNLRFKSPRYDVGVVFDELSLEAIQAITMLLDGSKEALVEMAQSRVETEEEGNTKSSAESYEI